MIVSSFKKALESGKFVVTSEVAPPKGTNLEKTAHHIDLLKGKVDALNITDHQSSVMRFPSIGGALLVKEMGGSPYCRWPVVIEIGWLSRPISCLRRAGGSTTSSA